MKNKFKGFHSPAPSDLERLWKDDSTLFVFDANVLLNLYGYAKQTREDFFKILNSISGSLWLPYHAGLEYQRRRLTVIRNEKSVFNNIEGNLDKILNVFKGDFEQLALKRRFPKLAESTEKLEKEIYRSISSYKKSVAHWNNEQPCVRSHDPIRDEINRLFENRVGDKPESQAWLDNLYEKGIERFKNRIPPGFKDVNKAKKDDDTHFVYDSLIYERQYGDLIVWMQLIAKAKEPGVNSVIFVTDDAKDDWWYKLDSNGNKTIGPLAELQAEIYSESGIDSFHMYSTSTFMKDGESYLSVDVDERSIQDARSSDKDLRRKYQLTNPFALAASQSLMFDEYLKTQDINSEDYSEFINQMKLASEFEKYSNVKSIKRQFPLSYADFKDLTEKERLDIYKDRYQKGGASYRAKNFYKYMELMERISRLQSSGETSEIQNWIENMDSSTDKDSEDK